MSEESKPIAPGGASPACEICGRGDRGMGGCPRTDPDSRYWRFTAECYQHGYQRERRRAESAEKELESCRSRLSTAEKERDEAEASVEQLVGDVQAVSRDYTDALNALRGVEWGGEAGHWEEAGCPECREGERSGHRAGCKLSAALYGSDTTDAPTAPKASEIASDSSALEKALGALRAVVADNRHPDWCSRTVGFLTYENQCDCWMREARAALGGAHVDVPKAPQKESFNQRTARAGLGHGPAPIDEDYPDVPKAPKEEVK